MNFYNAYKKTLLTALVCSLTSFGSFAKTIYVATDASGSNDGTTWTNAYTDLQSALINASDGDEIWVKNGVYKPTSSTDRTKRFNLNSGVRLLGGFDGTESTIDDWDPKNSTTTLSGDIGDINNVSDNSYTILFTLDAAIGTEINGFIIEAGNANDNSVSPNYYLESGGGIVNVASQDAGSFLKIKNVYFKKNSAEKMGGALYMSGAGKTTITDCIFEGNHANNMGGALALDKNNLTSQASFDISRTIFKNNSASKPGGAIGIITSKDTSAVTINASTFQENTSNEHGGAIYMYAMNTNTVAELDIANSIFDKNDAELGGSAVYSLNTNDATGTTNLINCTLYGNNTAGSGTLDLTEGSGANGKINVSNSIFWKNTAGYNNNFNLNTFNESTDSPTINVDYSLFEEADCNSLGQHQAGEVFTCNANNLFSADPKFSNAQNHDFSLSSDSDAIDAGNDDVVVGSTDVTNESRLNGKVDMGACEFRVTLPITLGNIAATAQEKHIELKWNTISEVNNAYFIIERSSDARNFEAIDKVNGAGNATTTQYYTVKDNAPARGINYYRLKQVDFDGQYEYTKIVSAEIQMDRIEIYPNPAQSKLHVDLSQFQEGTVNYQIVNLTGSVVKTGSINADAGELVITNLEELSMGSYFINLSVENKGNITERIMIAK